MAHLRVAAQLRRPSVGECRRGPGSARPAPTTRSQGRCSPRRGLPAPRPSTQFLRTSYPVVTHLPHFIPTLYSPLIHPITPRPADPSPMAIYHLSAKPVRRGAGRSATAAAAYRAGAEIADERTGLTFDYTRKQGVEHSEIILPTATARQDINWPRDRAALWNAAELAEHRKDSRVAREYELALPAELNPKQRVALVQHFAQDIADRHGNAVDIAIHAPHRDGDKRNQHAHLLATTRQVTPHGLGNKTVIELSDTDRKKRGLGPAAQESVARET